MSKSVSKTTLKYIKVKRDGRDLKIFMKDVSMIYVRRKMINKPKVPSFQQDQKPFNKSLERTISMLTSCSDDFESENIQKIQKSNDQIFEHLTTSC